MCGELKPSIMSAGLPIPFITEATRECIGLIDATTWILACAFIDTAMNIIYDNRIYGIIRINLMFGVLRSID